MLRARGDTNLNSKDIEVPFYGRLNIDRSGVNTGIQIKDFFGLPKNATTAGFIKDGGYGIIGANGAITNPIQVNDAEFDGDILTISIDSNMTGDEDEYVGFTKLTGNFTSTSAGDNGQPAGMGYNYHKSFGTDAAGESNQTGNFSTAARAGGGSNMLTDGVTVQANKISTTNVDNIFDVDGIIGFEITSATSVQTHRSGGDPIRLITFYGEGNGTSRTTLLEKELPELYFSGDKKLHLISDFNSNSTVDGAWAPVVFDSTSVSTNRDLTLEIVNSP